MAKNIVICCDGTGNDFDQPATDSNVVKLYNTLVIGPGQIAYYHPGVGTMGSPNARGPMEKFWTKTMGLAFGSGLLENVGDAYRYLMETYQAGDRIFLFGFSRGAYTARAVGSLLHVYGLLEPGNEQLIPYILRMFRKLTKGMKTEQKTFPAEEAFKYAFSREVEIYFCGVWDTVSSYGWVNSPIDLRFDGQNPIIRIGRHVVSIHEKRCCFQDNLWGKALPAEGDYPGQDIRQAWFTGVHSDVGGSYTESEAGLSKISFEWMLVEAAAQGLQVDSQRAEIVLGRAAPPACLPAYVKPDPKGMLHRSLRGAWWMAEFFPRRRKGRWGLPLGRWTREIPNGSLIHETVLESGTRVNFPKHYAVEEWVPWAPAGAPAAVAPMAAVVEKMAATAAPAPSAERLTRR
ncbi:MAG TPA: DUF2235 domain-containing protein [Acidobacteriaceae bacterium]|jgi:uncharacterized protein (DUF2235 family)|nr:DUF2235 domain-containing protein [Acidobacteriaceae bacterium]